jgi:hypothetical protein
MVRCRIGSQHRLREHPLQFQRAGAVGDAGQRRAQGPQAREPGQPSQRPGPGCGQVLELLGGRDVLPRKPQLAQHRSGQLL